MNNIFHKITQGTASFPASEGLHYYASQHSSPEGSLVTLLYKKGEIVYDSGQLFPGICEVVSGAVRISNLTEAGEEVTTEILTRTDLFGNLKELSENQSERSRAMVDSLVCIYEPNFLSRLIAEEPAARAWYSGYLRGRWLDLEKRLLRINTCKTIDHVAYLHQRFNRRVRDARGREQVLRQFVTQKDLADLIGATRQTVSQAMKELEQKRVY